MTAGGEGFGLVLGGSFEGGAFWEGEFGSGVWGDGCLVEEGAIVLFFPMDRMGTTEEMGRAIAILLSDASSYQTGTTIYADGGMSTYPSFAKGG